MQTKCRQTYRIQGGVIMTSIIYIGMDVHTTNFTLCCYTMDSEREFATVQTKPDYHEILKYMERIRKQRGEDCRFVCGYEAGCLGYSLHNQLRAHGVDCIILAPSTMPQEKGKRIKTDPRDAAKIAKCLAFHLYSPVYVPDAEDDAVKEYIRMRDDVNADLKRTKQQIIAFCTRHGFCFEGKTYWTRTHLKWLETLVFENDLYKEVLQEYLILYYTLAEKVDIYDARIEELSHTERYEEKVQKLRCFKGIATHTALSLLVEVGDYNRFRSAQHFASYLGLVPGNRPAERSKYEQELRRLATHICDGSWWNPQIHTAVGLLGRKGVYLKQSRRAILQR